MMMLIGCWSMSHSFWGTFFLLWWMERVLCGFFISIVYIIGIIWEIIVLFGIMVLIVWNVCSTSWMISICGILFGIFYVGRLVWIIMGMWVVIMDEFMIV